MQLHGALVEVHGVGVLLRGPSGIGKSETALELVSRGHCLVADDVVEVERRSEGVLFGTAPPLIRHHIELRGIGIVDVPELYGPSSVRDDVRIELLCRLEVWREGVSYERLGFSRPSETLAGVPVPAVVLAMRPSGNMATLIEVAARDHRMRSRRDSAAERLDARLRKELAGSAAEQAPTAGGPGRRS
jgi:HPr kinase/phosphorylase